MYGGRTATSRLTNRARICTVRAMKKSAKGSKSKRQAAPRAASKKTAPKSAPAQRQAKADAPAAPRAVEGRYVPPPLTTDGWRPFRYPPQ